MITSATATTSSWADGPLLAFDVETTGIEPATDRIVTATMVTITPGHTPQVRTWLADPGVDIPTEATEVHGISTNHARQHGHDAATVVAEVTEALTQAWNPTTPLCAFHASFDLSVLHAELRRHHQRDLHLSGPVIDPLCLDRHLDRYRKGKRTLTALCQHHQVRLDSAHTSAGDSLATARLAWRLAKTYPDQIGTVAPTTLHQQQIDWYRTHNHSFADYLDRQASRNTDPADTDRLRQRAERVRAEADDWPLRRDPHPPTPA